MKFTTAVIAATAAAVGAQDMGINIINGFPTNGDLWRGTVLVRGVGGCSGSFIGPNLVLTAAHCCDNNPQDGIQVFGGADGEIDFGFSIRHTNAGFTVLNDMCLVQLAAPKPEDFPHYDVHISNVPVGTDTVIVGYGLNVSDISGGTGFGEARYGLTQISSYVLNDMTVVARPGASPPQNACNGDSGGPIFAPMADGRWAVHGVTSRGMIGCPVTGPLAMAYYNNAVVNEKFLEDTAAGWGVSDLAGIGGNCASCCYDYEC